MSITSLGAQHLEAAITLWEQAGLTRPWNSPEEDYRRAVDGPSSDVLGVVDGEDVIGTVMVGHDGHRGWVYYLAVHPAHRRSGVGRELVRAAERALRQAGIKKVQLMVRRGNDEAAAFYERLEYERADVEVFARWLDGSS